MIKRIMASNPLAAFLVLTFLISWGGWIPVAYMSQTNPAFRIQDPVLALSPFAFGPTISGIVMSRVYRGQKGTSSLWKRVRKWRVGLGWYLFVLLSPAVFLALGIWTRSFFTGWTADFARSPWRTFAPPSHPVIIGAMAFLGGLIAGPLNEEIGWRGFALPYLLKKTNPFKASVILGIIWAAWHLPLFYIPGMSQYATSILSFGASVLVNNFYYTWVHMRTGGSVLMAILLHDSFNGTTVFFPMYPTSWWVIGVSALGVALLLILERRRWFSS